MSESKKTVYKIKYELEIEITRETTKTRRGEDRFGYKPEVNIKKGATVSDFDASNAIDQKISDRCNYIEGHFTDQIRDCFGIMFYYEGPIINTPFDDVKSETRKKILEATKRNCDQKQRQRLKTAAGPKTNKSKANYENEKEKFVNKSVEMLRTLKNEGVAAPTITDLAEKMFETYIDRNKEEQYYSIPLKELGKKLDLYEITFEELVFRLTSNLR